MRTIEVQIEPETATAAIQWAERLGIGLDRLVCDSVVAHLAALDEWDAALPSLPDGALASVEFWGPDESWEDWSTPPAE